VDVAWFRINAFGALLSAVAAFAIAPGVAGAAQWMPQVPLPGPADGDAGFHVAAAPGGTVVAVRTKLNMTRP
jgi:hypothetical protein